MYARQTVMFAYFRGWILGRLEQDGDAQVHEWLGEVDDRLPGVVDGHGGDGQVGALVDQLPDDTVPLARVLVAYPVHIVRHSVQLEPEAGHVGDGLNKEKQTVRSNT